MSITTFNWDNATNDLALPISLLESPDSLGLVLQQRFKHFLAEWFLNLREGVPYYRDILVKRPDPATVRSIFRQVILTTQDIDSIRSLTITPADAAKRQLVCDFIAVRSDGSIFDTSKLDDPLIIEV